MRILLLGANGQVGHELRRSLAPLGEITCTTRSGLLDDGVTCEVADFEKPELLSGLIERLAPDVVVNAAAYTAVDSAEDDVDAAFRANTEAPRRLAEACAARDALLVHYSTDYVFDGKGDRPYREDDATSPLGVYGASKLAGEQAIQAVAGRHMIFRTAWVYGNHGNNFMRTMLRLGAERDELRVVADQFGTPTPAHLIADITSHALKVGSQRSGIWHLTTTGQTSWQGFAKKIFEHALLTGVLSKVPEVIAISTADYPTRAQRPAFSCLETARLQHDFEVSLPDWVAGLTQVFDEAEA